MYPTSTLSSVTPCFMKRHGSENQLPQWSRYSSGLVLRFSQKVPPLHFILRSFSSLSGHSLKLIPNSPVIVLSNLYPLFFGKNFCALVQCRVTRTSSSCFAFPHGGGRQRENNSTWNVEKSAPEKIVHIKYHHQTSPGCAAPC